MEKWIAVKAKTFLCVKNGKTGSDYQLKDVG